NADRWPRRSARRLGRQQAIVEIPQPLDERAGHAVGRSWLRLLHLRLWPESKLRFGPVGYRRGCAGAEAARAAKPPDGSSGNGSNQLGHADPSKRQGRNLESSAAVTMWTATTSKTYQRRWSARAPRPSM